MSNTTLVNWGLKEEIGVNRASGCKSSTLVFPAVAQEMNNGSIMISDPDNKEVQAIVINKNKEVLWKQPKKMMDVSVDIDPVRCLQTGSFVGIDRKDRRVIEYDCEGKILWQYKSDDTNFYPISADRYSNGDTIIADRGNNCILLVDKSEDIKWSWKVSTMERPCMIQALKNNNFLVTDEGAHFVFEGDFNRNIIWSYGIPNNPGKLKNQLTYPQSALRLNNGNTLITDSMNHRLIEVDCKKNIVWKCGNKKQGYFEENLFFWPTWADVKKDGNILVADGRNKRVIEINRHGEILWSYGKTTVTSRLLAYPRSLQLLKNKNILVTDTMNNRILELDSDGKVVWIYGQEKEDNESSLFWPRSAHRLESGSTLISDGRNGRILSVSIDGSILRQVNSYYWMGMWHFFKDPHYVSPLDNGNWLIADPLDNVVIEIDSNNCCVWLYGLTENSTASALDDPHFAVRNINGDTLIADSGNDRVLIVNKEGQIYCEYKTFEFKGTTIKLSCPRYCNYISERKILIIDGGSGMVLVLSQDGKVQSCYQPVDEETKKALKRSRSLELLPDGGAYISDNINCRIIHV